MEGQIFKAGDRIVQTHVPYFGSTNKNFGERILVVKRVVEIIGRQTLVIEGEDPTKLFDANRFRKPTLIEKLDTLL